MNLDQQLKLQAWLDGELSGPEAAEVQAWLEKDPTAQSLLAELKNTNAALNGHEAALKLPESREFFWSKVRREIEQQEAAVKPERKPEVSWWSFLARHLAPAAGVAVLAFVMMMWLVQKRNVPSEASEMELASDSMGAYTFQDEARRMTVVWFYDKNDSEFTRPDVFASMDTR